MKKAFIFDLDGVLINNEPGWEIAKKDIFIRLFGKKIYDQLGPTVGLNMDSMYDKAVLLGGTASKQAFTDEFYKHALRIYGTVPIADGIKELGKFLIHNGFAIGIVSASPKAWIDLVIDRLSFKNNISIIISLDRRSDLAHKPAPDGYIEAIKQLKTKPENTFVLEDSNAGIQSAQSAGAYVIGLKQNLIKGYQQKNADVYAEKVNDVPKILKNFL